MTCDSNSDSKNYIFHSNQAPEAISFFRIPASNAGAYFDFARRGDIGTKADFITTNYKSYRICHLHFLTDDYIQTASRRKLKPNVLPTKQHPVSTVLFCT